MMFSKSIRQAGLHLNPKKCHLFQRKVSFLGHIISGKGVPTDPAKVAAVQKWPTPSDIGELRSFLHLASYYRRFIRGFATIANPLQQLTRKNRLSSGLINVLQPSPSSALPWLWHQC